jgi:hypothetical protein
MRVTGDANQASVLFDLGSCAPIGVLVSRHERSTRSAIFER